MADFSWSEFLAGSAVAKIIDEIIRYRRRKFEAKIDMGQNAKDIGEVLKIMKYIVAGTMYDRVIIFMGEDSAGILAAGKNLYITAQYEEVDGTNERLHPIIDDIQRWKADPPYYDLYSEMLTKGKVVIKTDAMPQSKLKDIYLTQGVKISKVYHLMTTKDSSKVFYCSIASTATDETSSEDRFLIESSVDKLIEIFRRHKKFY